MMNQTDFDDSVVHPAENTNVENKPPGNIIHVNAEDLNNLDKEELISKILSMQQNIKQLKCIINKNKDSLNTTVKVNKVNSNREFNFARHKMRHIFLKFLYLGWNYDGYVIQEDYSNSVENVLFQALIKTKLIRNRETSNYHRCGRTDKGVSAFSQVVSLTVRSKMKHGHGLITPEDYIKQNNEEENNQQTVQESFDDLQSKEIDYISVLNGVLPNDIRVISWAPLHSTDVSARFDCKRRVYHYYFPQGDLDIIKMNEACGYLIGEHDFRNLCKMDVNNGVTNYVRNVFSSSVSMEHNEFDTQHSDPFSICVFQIEASAFLWHQIRCIMGILFLVGQGFEEPTVIERLLNIEENPSKPQYSMAADLPLVLYAAEYEQNKVPKWFYGNSKDNLSTVISHLKEQWAKNAIRSSMIKSMMDSLSKTCNDEFEDTNDYNNSLHMYKFLLGTQPRIYKPLFSRPVCDTLEKRLKKIQSRKRIKLQ